MKRDRKDAKYPGNLDLSDRFLNIHAYSIKAKNFGQMNWGKSILDQKFLKALLWNFGTFCRNFGQLKSDRQVAVNFSYLLLKWSCS